MACFIAKCYYIHFRTSISVCPKHWTAVSNVCPACSVKQPVSHVTFYGIMVLCWQTCTVLWSLCCWNRIHLSVNRIQSAGQTVLWQCTVQWTRHAPYSFQLYVEGCGKQATSLPPVRHIVCADNEVSGRIEAEVGGIQMCLQQWTQVAAVWWTYESRTSDVTASFRIHLTT